jgi:hypothetical protein
MSKRTVNRLTGQQNLWLMHYLQHWNATQAAKEAGYAHPEKAGYKLRHSPAVEEAIQNELTNLVMSKDEALVRLSEQARGAYGRYLIYDPLTEGVAVDVKRLVADGRQHLIKAIKPTPSGQAIEFFDQQTALIWLGKHHDLFTADDSETDAALAAINKALDLISADTAVSL